MGRRVRVAWRQVVGVGRGRRRDRVLRAVGAGRMVVGLLVGRVRGLLGAGRIIKSLFLDGGDAWCNAG